MLTAIGDVMRRCYDKGWINVRDGNVSIRKGGSSYIYITPSGVRKNKIEVESLIKANIVDDKLVIKGGDTKPSGELEMHWLLLKDATKTRVVLHVHSTHIVAAMYAGWDLDKLALQFPEINRYTRVGPNVQNLPAVSKELAEATYNNMTNINGLLQHDIVGQANHGVCAVAGDPWSCYEHIERLDHVCEIVLKSGVRP